MNSNINEIINSPYQGNKERKKKKILKFLCWGSLQAVCERKRLTMKKIKSKKFTAVCRFVCLPKEILWVLKIFFFLECSRKIFYLTHNFFLEVQWNLRSFTLKLWILRDTFLGNCQHSNKKQKVDTWRQFLGDTLKHTLYTPNNNYVKR